MPLRLHLHGPGNDVELFESLLTQRFGFDPKNISILREQEENEQGLPTRQNIEREFLRLQSIAQRDDQVVILMAGHGSQQPDDDPDNVSDPEPDGYDEIFLPRDIGQWESETSAVKNGISDDLLRSWLQGILDKKAKVWIVVDACHSGTMIRGRRDEVVRQVPRGHLVPLNVIDQSRTIISSRDKKTPSTKNKQSDLLVALYASQAHEPTVEKRLPPENPGQKRYGLLTYTLNLVLSRANASLTYRDLAEGIQQQYTQWGRSFPTPMLEGGAADEEVLGEQFWPKRLILQISKSENNRYSVNAGALHGLTTGSVLAVYSSLDSKKSSKPIGHVEITSGNIFTSQAKPVEYAGLPLVEDLPDSDHCEVVFVDYHLEPIRLTVEEHGPLRERIKQQVLGKPLRGIKWVDDVAKADWVIQHWQGEYYLVPADGLATEHEGQTTTLPTLLGPLPKQQDLWGWLKKRLTAIQRYQGLLSLATPMHAKPIGSSNEIDVDLTLIKYRDVQDDEGKVLPFASTGRLLAPDDIIAFRVTNRGKKSIDVSLLFLDSQYGISSFFPDLAADIANRLLPNETITTPKARVNADTLGLEHMVMIATEADGSPINFSCLDQASLKQAQTKQAQTRGGRGGMQTPLGELLTAALYRQGGTRGLERKHIETYVIRSLSWRVGKGD